MFVTLEADIDLNWFCFIYLTCESKRESTDIWTNVDLISQYKYFEMNNI